jgi:hypothetical protein
LKPILTDDGSSPDEKAPGIYTLTANKTYVFILGGAAAPFASVQLTGYTAGAAVTSATIQDCNHGGPFTNEDGSASTREITDISLVVGEWIPERPPSGYVGVDGTGWTVGSGATACVVAAAGTGVGGAMFHLGETGAARTRLAVVVAGTGGDFRVAGHMKD